MKTYFITKQDFINFLKEISSCFITFYLSESQTQFNWKKDQRRILYWQQYNGDFQGLVTGGVRAQDPLKQFIFESKEVVSENFVGLAKPSKPLLLVGAKNCDLTGLDITDFVFMQGDFKDPFYIGKRQDIFIIASDCTNPLDTCFCLALDIKPYPEKNYDLGISDIGGGYIVEVVSEAAEKYISKFRDKFVSATTAQLQKRNTLRDAAISDVDINIAKHKVPAKPKLKDIMKKGFESEIWK